MTALPTKATLILQECANSAACTLDNSIVHQEDLSARLAYRGQVRITRRWTLHLAGTHVSNVLSLMEAALYATPASESFSKLGTIRIAFAAPWHQQHRDLHVAPGFKMIAMRWQQLAAFCLMVDDLRS